MGRLKNRYGLLIYSFFHSQVCSYWLLSYYPRMSLSGFALPIAWNLARVLCLASFQNRSFNFFTKSQTQSPISHA